MEQQSRVFAPRLFVTDIDNTLFDWVAYYVAAIGALIAQVEVTIGVPRDVLAREVRQVFTAHASIEYPFLVQELPSVMAHYGNDIDRMLREAVEPARAAFLAAGQQRLKPYSDVIDTLRELRRRYPGMPCAALTDAPRYVAMWKLNKLGLLPFFDAVYGLRDPRLPTHKELGRVKVDSEILLKHLSQHSFDFAGRIRILPDEYEKPGHRGLKTVLMDYELDEADVAERRRVIWIGDNRRKDVALGKRLGVYTMWASYGKPNPTDLASLADFSPLSNIEKNAEVAAGGDALSPPDAVLETFGDTLAIMAQL
ncbi:MAG: HAD family hydrolase [Deltaproteobacteria bacterium]|nr:HAD family hydrolase [Deltaproteobacteria bacterium]